MKALVVGGTGPTGPGVVEGLLDRGYDVTIFHSGRHEVEFSQSTTHIHGDPHFPETIAEALENGKWDAAIVMYGRLRHLVEALKGKAERLICVTGAAGYAAKDEPVWGPFGRRLGIDESGPWALQQEGNKFHYLLHASEEVALQAHADGFFNVTVIRPPNMYGPRQIGPEEWCVVRRILDGRRRMIVADNGLKIDARIWTENFVSAMLLVLDRPTESAGARYNVRDAQLYTMRQRINLIAAAMGVEVELVSLPYEIATPCYPLWRHNPEHVVVSDALIRQQLGYEDVATPEEAIPKTVEWLVANPPRRGAEEETQLGDPFDYEAEDRLMDGWGSILAQARDHDSLALPAHAHRYRHPKTRDEDWVRPGAESRGYKPGG